MGGRRPAGGVMGLQTCGIRMAGPSTSPQGGQPRWAGPGTWVLLVCLLSGGLLMAQKPGGHVMLASTIGPIDAGIVDALEAGFTQETGITVRHAGAGTGAALEMARRGGFDLVLVHAKALEEKFVADGFGTRRIPLMYNDFVIVGPPADPAGIRGMTSAKAALAQLAARSGLFLTRGDKSGTHVAELEFWEKAGLKPAGPWYQVFDKGSEGNVATLLAANSRQAYTVIDRASYLGAKDRIQLQVLVEGDEILLNRISIIPINPTRFPTTDAAAAKAFVAWLTHRDKGQKVISEFGKARFGQALFYPDAQE